MKLTHVVLSYSQEYPVDFVLSNCLPEISGKSDGGCIRRDFKKQPPSQKSTARLTVHSRAILFFENNIEHWGKDTSSAFV